MEDLYTDRVTKSFLTAMKSFSFPKEPFNLIAAFSGGADSSAMIYLLHKFAAVFEYKLYAVHVNHMIRGNEAQRDEDFCRRICDSYNIPLYIRKINVPEISRLEKTGIEECARKVRYGIFNELSADISKDGRRTFTATAHNADDSAETVIFNIARGTSLAGLCGIQMQRDSIIRPLLHCSKDEILGYCAENCIEYITDSTNSDTAYMRNKIRHEIIPRLKEINPSFTSTVLRMTSILNEERDFLEKETNDFLNLHSDESGITVSALNSIHPAIRKRAVFSYIKKATGITPEHTHVESIVKICFNYNPHKRICFSKGLYAVTENGKLKITGTGSFLPPKQYSITLNNGINRLPGGILAVFSDCKDEKIKEFKNIYKKSIQTRISSDKIIGVLFARSRADGDVFNINGVNRKVKKVLNETEPDLSRRNDLPMVCDRDGIIWIPGTRTRTGTYPLHGEAYHTLFFVNKNDITK